MSSADNNNNNNDDKDKNSSTIASSINGVNATTNAAVDDKDIWGNDGDDVDDEIMKMTPEQIKNRTTLLSNEVRIMKNEIHRLNNEMRTADARTAASMETLKRSKQLPYLVGNVVEILDQDIEDAEDNAANEEGAAMDVDDKRKGKSVVIKTSTRQTIFLPMIGLVPAEELTPGDLVGTNKDSYLILEKLPSEFDSRVKAMEVDEKPTEDYADIGGLDEQIQELVEAVVLPLTHKAKFDAIGIRPPKGALLWGPPGTGKTMLARACAKNTDAVFLKLAGPQLVQMFIGDGAKIVRDAFQLAKEKSVGRVSLFFLFFNIC